MAVGGCRLLSSVGPATATHGHAERKLGSNTHPSLSRLPPTHPFPPRSAAHGLMGRIQRAKAGAAPQASPGAGRRCRRKRDLAGGSDSESAILTGQGGGLGPVRAHMRSDQWPGRWLSW